LRKDGRITCRCAHRVDQLRPDAGAARELVFEAADRDEGGNAKTVRDTQARGPFRIAEVCVDQVDRLLCVHLLDATADGAGQPHRVGEVTQYNEVIRIFYKKYLLYYYK